VTADAPLPTPEPLPLAYPVYCGRGALAGVAEVVRRCAPAHRVAVITDTTVAAHHAGAVTAQFPPESTLLLTIPPGEQEKTRAQWGALTDALLAWGAGRATTVVALGGGVITDLAGFVAATYMRGIPVVQVPTTLLAMVDAAVADRSAAAAGILTVDVRGRREPVRLTPLPFVSKRRDGPVGPAGGESFSRSLLSSGASDSADARPH